MSKIKTKIKKVLLSLTQDQVNILTEMMKEDTRANTVEFFTSLLGEEFKRRKAEKEKRGPGRPRKDEEDYSGPEWEVEAERTLPVPPELLEFVPPFERKGKLVNLHDIGILEDRKKHWEAQNRRM